jgi:peptide/nickel transport system substrate-binding protein
MLKNIRKNLWFISAFVSKYKHLIIIGIVVSIFLGLTIKRLQRLIPGTSNKNIYLGLVGQYSANNLPLAVTEFLNSGLTTQGPEQTTILNLAENNTISESGKTYTYKLQPNLTWSDGTPIRSEDINISIPKVGQEMPDSETIKFNLPDKFAPFPSILSFPITNHQGLLPSPFKIRLKQRSSGVLTQIMIDNGVQKTFINLYPTSSQALTAYKLGQIDAIINLPLNKKSHELSEFGILDQFTNHQRLVVLLVNHKDPNLGNKPIRQGVAYSLSIDNSDRKKALTTINPLSWAYNPLIKEYLPNPQKAGQLIDTKIELELSTTPELLHLAEEIKNSINTDNLNLNIKVVSGTPEDFQLFLTTFNIPQDPDQYPFWHSTQKGNISGSTSEKLDKLLEDGRTTLDTDQRKEIYQEFQRVFAEELPAIVLFHTTEAHLTRTQAVSDIINSYWPR